MGWSLGWSSQWSRDIGYGVPAYCDHPDCAAEIDRGLAHLCGSITGSDDGCGLYFCEKHLHSAYMLGDDCGSLCERCVMLDPPEDEDDDPNPYLDEEGNATSAWPGEFDAKPDHPRWLFHKLHDHSWAKWRAENPDDVARIIASLPPDYAPPSDDHDTVAESPMEEPQPLALADIPRGRMPSTDATEPEGRQS